MSEGRAAEPIRSKGRFNGAPDADGRVIGGGEGRPRSVKPTRKRDAFSGGARSLAASLSWHGLALAAVLVLSAFLNLYNLTGQDYPNTYYAAAVKNMLTSWHNFFFVSFDAGFVSVDKPPLGLWIQAASAKLLGFSSLSLLLPQALAGIFCVALLYYLVRRAFGPLAGLVAALALATAPIF